MKKVKLWLIITTFLLISLETQAQTFRRGARSDIGYLAVGGSVGIMNYFGDLNPLAQYASTDIRGTRPSIGISVIRKFSPRLMLRGSFQWGRLTADDNIAAKPDNERHRYRYIRNAHFRNDIYELSMMFTYDLKASRFSYYRRANFTPYLTAGIALFYNNPMAKTPEGKWTALRPLRTEGQGLTRSAPSPNGEYPAGSSYGKMYSLIQPAIPVGAGVRFKLNDRTDLSVEVAYRILFTDYIDDVSGNYANPDDLPNDLSREMANRTLDPVSARSGNSRVEELVKLKTALGYDTDSSKPFNGFGNDGDKRGEKSNVDMYIVTGFHLTRIINVGLRCPKFR